MPQLRSVVEECLQNVNQTVSYLGSFIENYVIYDFVGENFF